MEASGSAAANRSKKCKVEAEYGQRKAEVAPSSMGERQDPKRHKHGKPRRRKVGRLRNRGNEGGHRWRKCQRQGNQRWELSRCRHRLLSSTGG